MNAQVHMTYDARKISQADAFHGVVVAFPPGKEQDWDWDQNGRFFTAINKIKVHSRLQSAISTRSRFASFPSSSAFAFLLLAYKEEWKLRHQNKWIFLYITANLEIEKRDNLTEKKTKVSIPSVYRINLSQII